MQNAEQIETIDPAGWESIKSVLPPGWRELAACNGLSPSAKEPPNASNVPAEDRLRTILALVALNASLRVTSALFAGAGIHSVSHVGIHGWMKHAAPALEALLGAMVGGAKTFAPERWAGYIVRAIDATTAQSPGADGTTARIHCALRLSDMRFDTIRVTDKRTGETLRNFTTGPDILDIADRGYSNPPGIAAAVDQGGDVLVRWNFASLPLFKRNGGQINSFQATRGLGIGQRRELLVEVHRANGAPIQGRLLVEHLPDDQAERARQRVRDEHGGRWALQMAPFIMLVTNVPRNRLTADLLFELYRLRWQIELQFKRDKSIGGLDRLPNFRDDTVKAWLLAKMLLGQIARRLVDARPSKELAGEPLQLRVSLPVSSPWESAVAAWMLVRNALFFVRFDHVALFLERFGRQIQRLKMAGRKARRQIDDFLGRLGSATTLGDA